MKLVNFGPASDERAGVLDEQGRLHDASSIVAQWNPDALGRLAGIRASLEASTLPLVPGEPRLGPCVLEPRTIVCVGLNYEDHAAESQMDTPASPILFMKASSSVVGPNDDVVMPAGSRKLDWEVELGVVMSKDAYCLDEAEVAEAIAGYCVVNDISERAWQLEGTGQWVKGKSAPTFCPLGPWLVTADEVDSWSALTLTLTVNGQVKQSLGTDSMLFGVDTLVAYISRHMKLRAGDVIATGTPPGVGLATGNYLRVGDVMSAAIDGLGAQNNHVVAE